MKLRSSRTVVHFDHPFALSAQSVNLPPGDYVVLREEERLMGDDFETYHTTATYLTLRSPKSHTGWLSRTPVRERDLQAALLRDQTVAIHATTHTAGRLRPQGRS